MSVKVWPSYCQFKPWCSIVWTLQALDILDLGAANNNPPALAFSTPLPSPAPPPPAPPAAAAAAAYVPISMLANGIPDLHSLFWPKPYSFRGSAVLCCSAPDQYNTNNLNTAPYNTGHSNTGSYNTSKPKTGQWHLPSTDQLLWIENHQHHRWWLVLGA